MKALGIDYGRAKIGLALSEGDLSEPWQVVKVAGWKDALEKIEQIVAAEQIEQVIIGVTEAEMGQEQEKFAEELGSKLSIPVDMQDETLSTFDAQQMAIQAGVSRKKRRNLEDAFAACLVLQSWLDNKRNSNL